jgi:hypothetical protein
VCYRYPVLIELEDFVAYVRGNRLLENEPEYHDSAVWSLDLFRMCQPSHLDNDFLKA